MTDRPVAPIRVQFPAAPATYTQGYFNQLIRTLISAFDRLEQPVVIRGGSLFLTNTPTSGYNLPIGSVFSDGGILTIIEIGDAYATSTSATVAMGSVTVTTT